MSIGTVHGFGGMQGRRGNIISPKLNARIEGQLTGFITRSVHRLSLFFHLCRDTKGHARASIVLFAYNIPCNQKTTCMYLVG